MTWKNDLWNFSSACTAWGMPKEETDKMNGFIQRTFNTDTTLYALCKYSAEKYCLSNLKSMRNRNPRDDELKKAWHQRIPQHIRMKHPEKGYQL